MMLLSLVAGMILDVGFTILEHLSSKTQQLVHKQTHHKYMETVRVYLYLRSIIYVYLSAAQLLLFPVPKV